MLNKLNSPLPTFIYKFIFIVIYKPTKKTEMKKEVINWLENFDFKETTYLPFIEEQDIFISLKNKQIFYNSDFLFHVEDIVKEFNNKTIQLLNCYNGKIIANIDVSTIKDKSLYDILKPLKLDFLKNIIPATENKLELLKEFYKCKGDFNGKRCCEHEVMEIYEGTGNKNYFDKLNGLFVDIQGILIQNNIVFGVNVYKNFKQFKTKQIKDKIKKLEKQLTQFK